MAQGRMLNKSISCSRKVAELIDDVGPYGGLFFTWLIPHLDREGRVHGDPDVLKGMVAPRVAGITPAIIRQTAGKAHELGLIVWYEAAGDSYIAFPGFEHNQPNMRKGREPESSIPEPTSNISRLFDGMLPAECRQVGGNVAAEEKKKRSRREEEEKEKNSCPELPEAGTSAPQVALQLATPVIEIPLSTGPDHVVTQQDVDEWARAYPAVDVMQELRNIRQWNLSTPRERKTKSGIRRHITGWLARSQNRGGGGRQTNNRPHFNAATNTLIAALNAPPGMFAPTVFPEWKDPDDEK